MMTVEEVQEETELVAAAAFVADVQAVAAAFGTPDCCCCCWCWAWLNLAEHEEGAALKREAMGAAAPTAVADEGLPPPLEEAEEEAVVGCGAGAVSKSMLVGPEKGGN